MGPVRQSTVAVPRTPDYAAGLVSVGREYLIGGAIAVAALVVLLLAGWSWRDALLVVGGLSAVLAGFRLTRAKTPPIGIEVEDDHIHPIPVLDAPKGTFDLIAGLSVRLNNERDEPVGVRIDTELVEKAAWGRSRRLAGVERETLLAPSVIPAQTAKSFFVKNYTRLPAEIDELTTQHGVQLLVEVKSYGFATHDVFLREKFVLPKGTPPQTAPSASDGAPLLPFDGELASSTGGSATQRLKSLAEGLVPRRKGEVKIHRLRKSDDTLEGLIDEIEAELGDEEPRG